MSKFTHTLFAGAAVLALSAVLAGPAAAQQKTIVGLITKTNTNPFFVKMRAGAEAKAKELGVELRSFAGRSTATTRPRWRRSRA